MKTKLVGAAGRYGARYGQHIKRKIAKIEDKQRKKQVCPFCEAIAKRTSKGIWECKRCKKRFAAHAYFLEKGALKVKIEKRPMIKKKKVAEPVEKKVTKKPAKAKTKSAKTSTKTSKKAK